MTEPDAEALDPTDEERAARMAEAQRLIAEAEAQRAANPPAEAAQADALHTVGTWAGLTRFECKLCPWDVLVHAGRTEAEAEEEVFRHYTGQHLGIRPDEEQE